MPSNGSAQLHAISAALKARGEMGVKREMTAALRAGAQPLIPAVKQAAREKLPKAGGLNEQVAGQRVRVSVRGGARTAGVRLVTTAPDTKQTDSGFVRHPVFGHKDRAWITQQIPQAAGWWTDTLVRESPTVTPVLLAAMEAVAAKIRAV